MNEGLPEIRIECEGSLLVDIRELYELQGNLKELTESNYVKLRNSIIEYGFSFPTLIWIDTEGKKWIIDAHQRVRTLKKMAEEGYTIPPLPAVQVFASDKTTAKKKLLLLNSRFGKITQEGFYEFMHETGYEIPMEDVSDFIEIPEVALEYNPEKSEENDDSPSQDNEVQCPNCKLKFTPEK